VDISSLKYAVKNLNSNVGVPPWSSTSMYVIQDELRRDLDLLFKKHNLCIKHTDKSVTLVSCANKNGDKRGKV